MCKMFKSNNKTAEKDILAQIMSKYEQLLNYVQNLKLSDLKDVASCLNPTCSDVLTFTGSVWNGVQSGVNIDQVAQEVEERIGQKLKEVTYEELVTLRNSNLLVPGQFYRIVDYVTKVKKELDPTTGLYLCDSAEHPFDILIQALTSNKLNEKCQAMPHKNDTYFLENNLSLWEIHYTLDNDKYTWLGGKGTIYYMKDEFGNKAPYDFKNILINKYTSAGDIYMNSLHVSDTHGTNWGGYDLFNQFNCFNFAAKGNSSYIDTGWDYKKVILPDFIMGESLNIQGDKFYVLEDFSGDLQKFIKEVTPTYYYTFSTTENNNIIDASLTDVISENKITYNRIADISPSLVIIKTPTQQQIINNIFTNCTNSIISDCTNSNYQTCNRATVNNSDKFTGTIQSSYVNKIFKSTCENISDSQINNIHNSDIKTIRYCFVSETLQKIIAPKGIGSNKDWEFLNLEYANDCTIVNSINNTHVGESLYVWPDMGEYYGEYRKIIYVYGNSQGLWGWDIKTGTLINITNP